MTNLDTLLGSLRDEYEPDPAARSRVRRAVAAGLISGGVGGTGIPTAAETAGGSHTAVALGKVGTVSATKAATMGGAGASVPWLKVLTGTGTAVAIAAATLQPSEGPAGHAADIAPAGHVSSYAGHPQLPDSRPIRDEQLSDLRPIRIEAPEKVRSEALEETKETMLQKSEPSKTVERVARLEPRKKHAARRMQGQPARPEAPAPTAGSASTLSEELRLIRGASQALRRERWSEARALLDQHRASFPTGVLAHERGGLAILAQCEGERQAAIRSKAEAFVAGTPDSPLAESISKRCLR